MKINHLVILPLPEITRRPNMTTGVESYLVETGRLREIWQGKQNSTWIQEVEAPFRIQGRGHLKR